MRHIQAAVSWICAASFASGGEVPIMPDAATQAQIERWMGTARPGTRDEHFRVLGELSERAHGKPREFVRQVVYYTYHLDDQMLVPVVYRLFKYCDISEADMAVALSDLLYHEDVQLRGQAWRLWPFVLGRGSQFGTVNLSPLRDVITGKGSPDEATRLSLCRAAFESSPNAAFLLFHLEVQGKELVEMRRMERAISNDLHAKRYLGGLTNGEPTAESKAAIATLGKSEKWWARMFVSEIMVQNREFRDAELVRTLKADGHELVRRSAASLDADDGLRASKVDK